MTRRQAQLREAELVAYRYHHPTLSWAMCAKLAGVPDEALIDIAKRALEECRNQGAGQLQLLDETVTCDCGQWSWCADHGRWERQEKALRWYNEAPYCEGCGKTLPRLFRLEDLQDPWAVPHEDVSIAGHGEMAVVA